MNIESNKVQRDQYSWTMIKRDNQTRTESSVLSGGVAELNCQTSGHPKPSIEWILPDGSMVRAPYTSEDRRIVISNDGKLTLRSADNSDAGVYRCIATNYLDADVLSFRVTVLSPDVEEEEVNGVKLSRSVGESLRLDCEETSSPQASVQWILPDHTVMVKSYGNKKLYQNGTLGIYGLTERDQGFYRCLTANDLGVDLLVSLVTVSNNGSKQVAVTADIEGSGDDMQPNTEEDRLNLQIKVTPGGTLIIQQVSTFDRGHYKCMASNPAGIDTATVRLHVVAAPPELRLDRASGFPVQHTETRSPSTSAFANGTLHLKNLDISDSGKYECIATSSTGSERRVVTLSVEKTDSAPQITEISDRRTELMYGAQLQLNCTATGNPKPRIIWRLPSKALVDQYHR
ncbi:immunoglobulin superfamily member 10 [Astyanax mexicanus]|nr:immunoglobulin superfamily member 10 [Astyanax mexicanus]